jgi:gliding motility-associated-like protein
MRSLLATRIQFCALTFVFLVTSLTALSQAVPTAILPRTYAIFHETDNQQSITITWNAAVTINGLNPAGLTVRVAGVPVAPINAVSTVAAPFQTTILLPAQILVGQSVTVQWAGGSGANAFGPSNSVNNRPIRCSDFAWDGTFTPTPACAPVDPLTQMVFSVKPGARNSSFWSFANTRARVRWNGAAVAPVSQLPSIQTNAAGVPTPNSYYVTFDAESIPLTGSNPPGDFVYPVNDPVCGYTSNWIISLVYPPGQGDNLNCPLADANQTVVFASHNNDDTGVGADVLMPPTVVNSDQVCLGTNVNMTFSDNTDLNCNPTTPPIPTNDGKRWVRVVYGSTNLGGGNTATSNIPNIRVNGVPVTDANGNLLFPGGYSPPTYPFGTPDAFGVVEVPATVTTSRGILNLITTSSPTGQVVGQRFIVRLDYWNECNQYDGVGDISNLRVSVENDIEIIGLPTPPVPVDQVVCKGVTPNAFTVTGVPAGATVNFYRNNNGSVGTLIATDNTSPYTLPISNYLPGPADSLQTNTLGFYKIWASYTPAAALPAVNCETIKVPVTISIRMPVPTPAEIFGPIPAGNHEVCADGSTLYNFSITGNPNSPTLTPTSPPTPTSQLNIVGGATQYNWSFDVPGNITLTPSGTTNKNVAAVFGTGIFGAGTSTIRNLQVSSSYTSGVACPSNNETDAVTIYRVSNGGSIIQSPVGDICDESTKDFELTGHVGSVIEWQVSVNAGPFTVDTDLGNASNPAPKTFSTPGSYQYRARVRNGVCSDAFSGIISFNVNPVPPKPIITSTPPSATICADGSTVTLTSSNAGGIGTDFRWFKAPDFVTPIQTGASNQLILSTVSQSGSYAVEVRGPGSTFCTSVLSDPTSVTIRPLPTASDPVGGGSVCNFTPAPSITWNFTGTPPFNFTISRSVEGPLVIAGHNSTTFTIPSPQPSSSQTYQITSLTDLFGCNGTNLGAAAIVNVISTAPPSVQSFTGTSPVCDDGGATDPPNAILDLAPNSVETYFIKFKLRNLNTNVDGPEITIPSVVSTASGQVIIEPTYAQMGGAPEDLGYQIIITEIFNVITLCAGAVPINGPTLVINSRPLPPTSLGDITACSNVTATTAISVNPVAGGLAVDWYAAASGGLVLSTSLSYSPGVAGTYHAGTRNIATGCASTSRTPVQLISDALPPVAAAGPVVSPTCDDVGVLVANSDGVGIGTWTVSNPAILYNQTFSADENNQGLNGASIGSPTSFTSPSNEWSITVPASPLGIYGAADPNDWFKVDNGVFSARDVNDLVTWQSRLINISAFTNVSISIDLRETGTQIASEFIRATYSVDGGAEVLIGEIVDDATPIDNALKTFSITTGAAGTNLRIFVRVQNNADADRHTFDNVQVFGTTLTGVAKITDVNNENSAVTGLQVGNNTFTWTIRSVLGACAPTQSSVTIVRNPLPTTFDIARAICEDAFGTFQNTSVDLTVYNNDVTSVPAANRVITWNTSPTLGIGTQIATPTSFAVNDNDVLYVRVLDTSTGCENIGTTGNGFTPDPGSVDFTVNGKPSVVNLDGTPAPDKGRLQFCDDNVIFTGTASAVDLTVFQPEINPGGGLTFTWHSTQADADAGINPFATPSNRTVSDGDAYVVRVVNGNGCFNTALSEIVVNPLPAASSIIGSATRCVGDQGFYFVTPLANREYSWTIPGIFTNVGGTTNTFSVFLEFNAVTPPAPPPTEISLVEFGLFNTGYTSIPLYYTAGGVLRCAGDPNLLAIEVNATPPAITIVDQGAMCTNEQRTYATSTNNAPLSSYQWDVTPPTAATLLPIPNSNQVQVTSGVTTPFQLRVTEISNTCTGAPATLSIVVNGRPDLADTDQIDCSRLTSDIIFTDESTTPVATTSYRITSVTTSAAGLTPDAGNFNISVLPVTTASANAIANDRFTNLTGGPISVTYNVVPITAGCEGTAEQLTFMVRPEPFLSNTLNASECSDVPYGKNLAVGSGSFPATTFNITGFLDNASITANAGNSVAIAGIPFNGRPDNFLANERFENQTPAIQSVQYTVVPVSADNCAGAPTNILFEVKPEPLATPLTTLPNMCSDGNVNYILSGSITNGVPSNFLWRVLPPDNNINLTGQTTGAGSTISTINDALTNISNPGTNQFITYTVTPTGTAAVGSCVGNDFKVAITVEPKPQGALQNLAAICSSLTNPVNYVLQTGITNNVASNFSWQAATNSFVVGESFLAAVGTNTITDVLRNVSTPSNQRTVSYTVTPAAQTGLNCVGAPFTVNVPVNPEPVGADRTLTAICSDTPLLVAEADLQQTINSLGNALQSTFQWQVLAPDNNANVSNQTVAPALGTTSSITDILHNISGANQNITYTVTPTTNAVLGIGTCVGQPFRIEVVSKSEPVGFDDTDLVCSDLSPGYDIQLENIDDTGHAPPGNAQPSTFVWRPLSDNPDVTGDENLGNRTLGVIGETLVNVTSGPEVVVYEVTPTGTNACLGEVFEITVTVDPKPVGVSVTSVSPPAIAVTDICSGNTFTYDLQNNVNLGGNNVASSFEWAASSASLFISGEITANTNTPVISNPNLINSSLPAANGTVVYTVTPRSIGGNCLGPQFTVEVVVKPLPRGSDQTLAEICTESTLAYSLQNNVNAFSGVFPSDFVWKAQVDVVGMVGESLMNQTTATINDQLTINDLSPSQKTVVYEVTPTGQASNGCVGPVFEITVPVNPKPIGATFNESMPFTCSDVAHNVDLQAIINTVNSVQSSFVWVAINNTNVTGESLTNQSGDFITDIINNKTAALSELVEYTVTPTSDVGSCVGPSFTVFTRTQPEPEGTSQTVDICSANAVAYSLQNNINLANSLTSNFLWRARNNIVDITGESLTNQLTNTINDLLTNTSNPGVAQTVEYDVTPTYTAGGCVGDLFTVTVNVIPRPAVSSTIMANICSDVPFTLNPQVNITNSVVSTFTWTALFNAPISPGSPAGSGIISESLENVGGSSATAVYTVQANNMVGALNCAAQTTFTITQPIDPKPVTNPSLSSIIPICSDLPLGIQARLSTNGISIPADSWDVFLVSKDTYLSGTPSQGASSPETFIENDVFNNVTRDPGLVIYRVTPIGPASTFCRGSESLVRVRVDPEPVMNPALAATTIVCSDEALNIQLSTVPTAVDAASYIYRDLQNPITVSVPPSVGNAVPEPVETGIGDRPFTVIQNDKYTNTANLSLFRTYVVKPKSSAGCLGNIQNIPVQVLPEPTFTITAPPPICSGDALGLQLAPAVGSTSIGSYQVTNINWDILPAPGLLPGGTNIAIGSTLAGSNVTINDTYTNGTNATLTATYRVFPIATAVAGKSCAGDEQNATVQIKPSPIVLDNLDEIVCSNAINGITINTRPTSAAANSYEIIRDPLPPGLAPGVYTPGSTTIVGNSTANIANDRLVNSSNNPVPVVYRVRANTDVTPATGCFGPEEQIAVLVEPQFIVTLDGTTNLKPDICGGTDQTNIVFSSPSNPSAGTVTFDFTVSPSISGAVSGANFNEGDAITQSLVNTTNAPIVVTYTVTPEANSAAGGLGCPGVTNTTTVTVRPKPKLTASPATFTICEGEPLGVDFATPTTAGSGAGPVLFELIRVEDPLNAPTAPANGISGFNGTFPTNYPVGADVLNDVLSNTNIDGLQHSIRYVLLPKFTIPTPTATCLGDESLVTVNVSPRAVLAAPTNVEVCSGEEFSQAIVVQEADPSSTLITWTRVVNPSTGITGSSNGAGDNITQVIFNNTNSPGTVTYTFTPKSFNCTGPTQNLVATVLPAPKVDPITTQRLCANDVLSVNPIPSPTTGVSFRWTNDNTDPLVTGPATGTGSSINDAWSNVSDGLAVITYEITPRVFKANSDVCEGASKFMTVNIAPPVNGNIFSATGDDDAFICDGDDELITFESTGLSKFRFTYEVDDGLTVTPITRTNANSFVTINESPLRTTTYRLLSVTDAFGCVNAAPSGNTQVIVNVGRTDASFTVPGAVINCSPFPVDFQYNQVNGINYTWRWADAEPDSSYQATTNVSPRTVRHRFVNTSTSSTKNFKVELEASIPEDPDPDNIYPRGGCLTRTNRTVSVYPIVQSIISVDKTDVCSGEQINFRNSSRGVNSDKWFYRVEGTTDELGVRTGTYSGTQKPSAFTSFILDNAIVSPSINIEVVYQASNIFGCTAPDSITTIRVFRGPVADFDLNNGPTQFNVVSTVDVVNTSTPLDAGNFTYQWDFGLDATPETASGIGTTFNLTYSSPGLKEVTLVVTSNAGGCQDTQTKQFEIEIPPLSADFIATPLFACFPAEVTAESFTAGNVVEWELIDDSGRTTATSSEPAPVFAITNPGKYTLRLTTYYETLPDNTASQIKDLEIYDLPRASFEVRPTTVFIPDQEVTTFNFSTGANLFEWDFGDGNKSSEFEPKIRYRVEGEYPIQLVAGYDHGDKDIDGDGILDGNITCYDTLSRTVIAKDGGITRIPNSFTPSPNGPNGGNGGAGSFNDVFLPITKGVEEFQMQIFDRWGNLVFESRDKNQGWDGYDRNGNLLKAGVYVYKLVLRLSNGERTTQVGDVTLIR